MATLSFLTDSERWNAVRNRDPAADGFFVYCVKTTKIYCRPICKARLARRSNVEFFATVPEAVEAGYRACKRCKPELFLYIPEAEQSIFRIRQMLEDLPPGAPLPKLEVLASQAGLTKYHFHRSFKKATGSTPREYALSRRRMRLSDGDNRPTSVDATSVSTPSLSVDSAMMSGAAATPDELQTPIFDIGDWAMDDFDGTFSFEDEHAFDYNAQAPHKSGSVTSAKAADPLLRDLDETLASIEIYYSMVETATGVLIMAFQDGQLCKMEFAASAVDVLTSLHAAFPLPTFLLVPIEELEYEKRLPVQRHVAAVVAALEQPQQKSMGWQMSSGGNVDLT